VSHITAQLSDECIECIKSGKKSQNGPKKQFGKDMKFIFLQLQPLYPDTGFLVDLAAASSNEILKDFSMKYDDVAALVTNKEDVKRNHSKSNEVGKYYSTFC
jgi:hypothetical protein